jgi:hypothetical protein
MMAGPDGAVCGEADAVPKDVKMLSAAFDMFNDDALVIMELVAVFLLASFGDLYNLIVSQAFVFERIDTDMVQWLASFCAACYNPHIMKSLLEIFGIDITDLKGTYFLILALGIEVVGSRAIIAADMAFDNQGCGAP